jgi:putative phosphoesterase
MPVAKHALAARSSRAPARHIVALAERGLRMVVVADTHGRPHPESHRHIAALQPDRILHAGDIGDLGVLSALEKIAPVLAIRGNIDERLSDTPDALTLDVQHDARLLLRLLLVHIGVAGPRLRREVVALARAERASLVVCGHSHVPFIGRDKGLGVFNPGSIGPRRFQLPVVFGVIDIDAERVSLKHVDCETGRTWAP